MDFRSTPWYRKLQDDLRNSFNCVVIACTGQVCPLCSKASGLGSESGESPAFGTGKISVQCVWYCCVKASKMTAVPVVQEILGRDFGGMRFGPRPIDLDIIFYGSQEYNVRSFTTLNPGSCASQGKHGITAVARCVFERMTRNLSVLSR